MDKSTLSNYGWVVIAVLVLSVMLALATPFGTYISNAVKSTTEGLFDVQQNALGAADMVIGNQSFEENGGGNTPEHHIAGCATFDDGVTLTWEELQLEENSAKYGYFADSITDTTIYPNTFLACYSLVAITIPNGVTSIGWETFYDCNYLTSVTIPDSVTIIEHGAFAYCPNITSITISSNITSIGDDAFKGCTRLNTITFNGTRVQWNAIEKGEDWKYLVPATKVVCSDGAISLK